MADEVKIKVTVEDRSKPGLSSVKDGLGGVETAADKAGSKVSDFDRRSKELGKDLASLDRSIATSKASLSMLASALADTDDAAQRLDIKKAMSKVQSDLAATSKAKKIKLAEMLDLDPGPAAKSFMSNLGGKLSGLASSLSSSISNPVGLALGTGIALAAAPGLASTLAGAVSAGGGAAVIGGGIALAVKNSPGIQQAGKSAGEKFMKALGEGAKAYNLPIAQSLGILEDAGERVAKRLGDAFSATSSSVVPLVRDITQGVEGFVDVIAGIAERSGPALAGLGDGFRLIMDGLGDGLEAMTQNSESIGDSLRVLGGIIGEVARETGEFIGWLDKISDNPFLSIMPLLKDHFREAADASDTMKGSTSSLAAEMDNAGRAAQGETDALKGLSDELRGQTDPVFALLTAQDNLKSAQDRTKKATKEHGEGSQEAKKALRDQARAALDLEKAVGELGGKFNGTMTPALRATLKAAGMTDGAIDSLEGQFREAKKAAGDFAGNYKANVSAPGATQAIGRLYSVRDAANSIPRAIDIAMRITGVTNVSKQAAAIRKAYGHGGITRVGAAASGGIRDDDWTIVGENGPEIMRLPPSTQIKPNSDLKREYGNAPLAFGDRDTKRLKREWKKTIDDWKYDIVNRTDKMKSIRDKSSGGGSSPGYGDSGGGFSGPLEIVFSWEPSGNRILDAIAAQLRLYVKNNAGGNVQLAFGTGARAN